MTGRDASVSTEGAEATGADALLGRAERAAPARQIEIGLAKLLVHLRGGNAEREQAVRLQRDADLALHATDAIDLGHAGDGEQRLGDGVGNEPRELFGAHARRGDRVGQDGAAGDLDAVDDGVADGARQVGADLRNLVAHVVGGAVGVLAERELHHGQRQALLHDGGDVLDVTQPRHRVLDPARHLRLQLDRRGAGLLDADQDGRQVDIRCGVDAQLRESDQPAERQ